MRAALVAIVLCPACGGGTTPPEDLPPSGLFPRLGRHFTLVVSGQSNAIPLSQALNSRAEVYGLALGGRSILCWNADSECWGWQRDEMLRYPASVPSAFVWWQGESDQAEYNRGRMRDGAYAAALTSLIQRVRDLTRHRTLPIIIVELGAHDRGKQVSVETLQVIGTDPRHMKYIGTNDLAFPDGTHAVPAGQEVVAARIIALFQPDPSPRTP